MKVSRRHPTIPCPEIVMVPAKSNTARKATLDELFLIARTKWQMLDDTMRHSLLKQIVETARTTEQPVPEL